MRVGRHHRIHRDVHSARRVRDVRLDAGELSVPMRTRTIVHGPPGDVVVFWYRFAVLDGHTPDRSVRHSRVLLPRRRRRHDCRSTAAEEVNVRAKKFAEFTRERVTAICQSISQPVHITGRGSADGRNGHDVERQFLRPTPRAVETPYYIDTILYFT